MLLLIVFSLLVLPPDDLPKVAYPSTALIASITPQQLNPYQTQCEGKNTADTFWTTCYDRQSLTLLMCHWIYLGDGEGLIARWQTGCSEYGGL